MNSRDIVKAINSAMAHHLVQLMRHTSHPTDAEIEESFAAGARVLDKLRPAGSPVPAVLAERIKQLALAISIETTLGIITHSLDKGLDKHLTWTEGKIENLVRQVREEALAEFTDGANKADDMIGAVLKERGQ